ncbi:MAG TPA: hypothetical protein VKU36_04935 [Candidatus Babeliales bacterium]|nr:hypothetical protein [Candidatus Babeliales bacterium]
MNTIHYIIVLQLLSSAVYAMECFDILPYEVRSNIIKTYFNVVIHEDDESPKHLDQEKLEKYIVKTPIILGIKYTREFDQLQKICRPEIGGKKIIAAELFRERRECREAFMRMAERSYIRQIVEGNISTHDYTIITTLSTEAIRKGLKLEILTVNRILNGIEFIGGTTALTSWLVISWLQRMRLLKGKIVTIPVAGAFGGFGLLLIARFLMYCSNPQHQFSKNLKKITL